MTLLKAENITKEFVIEGGVLRRRTGSVRALRGVSFELNAGDSLGLVGESGSGKTTLAKILARMLRPDQGRLLWEGRPVETIPAREWAGNIQMVFQDPSASLNPKLTVRTLLEEPLRLRSGLSREAPPDEETLRSRMAELLATVGLPPDILFYYPHQFSGGQKQRLAIARALAVSPKVLVADEPVSALDLSIQAQILNLLMDLKEKFRLTTLIISHDLAVVSYLAGRVLVLKDGEAVESGPIEDILARPQHPYTRALLDAVPKMVRA